jgi:hypothetical protein
MENLIPPETAEQVRTIELHRLDTLINRIWEQCTADNLAAINTYTRLADQRAKLMGLYPREGHTAQVVNAVKDDQINQLIRFVTPGQNGGPDQIIDMTAQQPNPYPPDAKPDLELKSIEGPRARQEPPFGSILEEPRKPHPFDPQPPARPEPMVDPYGHVVRGVPDGRFFIDNRGPVGNPNPPSAFGPRGGGKNSWMK